jgi:hypothetical protein
MTDERAQEGSIVEDSAEGSALQKQETQVELERRTNEDIGRKNWAAVMAAVNRQNYKLAEYQQRLIEMSVQLEMLQKSFRMLQAKNMEDLVAQFGNGPTEDG